ncbi:hypothetical protein [Planobispora rosea]|uniref:hypothetical protein n=1 Tax=Planobispora rosea TaxID=35762 RepID=UPI00114D3A22|nr:hypothetical protein [Planobispora rosea]
MIETAGAPPHHVRTTIALLHSVFPYGLAVTAIILIAATQTHTAMQEIPVTVNDDAVPAALHQFGPFVSGRVLSVALFFGLSALVFATLAVKLRAAWNRVPDSLGARRRSPLISPLTGLSGLAYLAGLVLTYLRDPVRDYRDQPVALDDGLTAMPFDMGATAPGWYLPALAVTLLAAAVTQGVAVVLVVRDPITGDVP